MLLRREQQKTPILLMSVMPLAHFGVVFLVFIFRAEILSIVFMGLHLFLVELSKVRAKMTILTTVKALDLLG